MFAGEWNAVSTMNRQTAILLTAAGCTALVIYLAASGDEGTSIPTTGPQPILTAAAPSGGPAPAGTEPLKLAESVPVPALTEGAKPEEVVRWPATRAELNQLADGPLDLRGKMKVLGSMMREATGAEAAAAAQRAIFVVKNADYREHLQPLLLEGNLKPEALEVLGLNAYDRPLDILLPLWAEIRQRPGHPLQAAAADGLEFHLGEMAGKEGDGLAEAIRGKLQPDAAAAR